MQEFTERQGCFAGNGAVERFYDISFRLKLADGREVTENR
jgi:hypothetical protein